MQCLLIDRLVISDVNKKLHHSGGRLGKNDGTWGQANSTGMPPNQKCKKAE
jgi:hypothetical protein